MTMLEEIRNIPEELGFSDTLVRIIQIAKRGDAKIAELKKYSSLWSSALREICNDSNAVKIGDDIGCGAIAHVNYLNQKIAKGIRKFNERNHKGHVCEHALNLANKEIARLNEKIADLNETIAEYSEIVPSVITTSELTFASLDNRLKAIEKVLIL